MDEFQKAIQMLNGELEELKNADRTAEIEAEAARFKAEITERFNAEKKANAAEIESNLKFLKRYIARIEAEKAVEQPAEQPVAIE